MSTDRYRGATAKEGVLVGSPICVTGNNPQGNERRRRCITLVLDNPVIYQLGDVALCIP